MPAKTMVLRAAKGSPLTNAEMDGNLQSVSRFQGREAMWQTPHRGVTLFEAVEAAITDPSMLAKYKRAWDDLQEFHRDSEMLIAIANMLELTDEDLDKLFILAASIKV